MKLEIEKNLVVSSSHAMWNDFVLLSEEQNIITYGNPYDGFWTMVYLPFIEEHKEDLEKYSPAFREIVAFAVKHEEGFTYLKFDGDGPVLEKFPTFEW